MKFFKKYRVFIDEDNILPYPNRLNNRYTVLIEKNIEMIRDKKILDIGSHDGRWSFAAIKNGASHVQGIELRSSMVEKAKKNMRKYRIPKKKYSFISGNIFEELSKLKPKSFDTIFCFGILYHVYNHLQLFSELKRLNSKNLILDTDVITVKRPFIKLRQERNEKFLVGIPSQNAINLMLDFYGFQYDYVDWNNSGIEKWGKTMDYKNGSRVTCIIKNND